MKKLFVGILIFAIISIGVTGILIKIENNKTGTEKNETSNVLFGEENKNQDNEKNDLDISNEKTLDLYGTYNENDLLVEEIEEKIELSNLNTTINIPVIKGLKDKSVEEKINNDIRKRIIEKLAEISEKHDNIYITDTNTYIKSNFSNVISYNWSFNFEILNGEKYNYESVFLNYELVNGERLNFEDLFVKNADLYSIVRRIFYRQVARESLGGEIDGSAYYDKESGKWLKDAWDPYTGEDITVEYIPYLTEYDVSKRIENFMMNEDKNSLP